MTMDILLDSIIGNVFEIIATIITLLISCYVIPTIKNDLVPWLKEKRIFSLVKKFVQAAEKLSETGAIEKVDKKQTVINLLENKGIEVTIEIEAYIETACKQLDIIVNTAISEIKKEDIIE